MCRRDRVIFVFGHLDLKEHEFEQHYVPQLQAAIKRDDLLGFVVGDAPGADAMSSKWLVDHGQMVVVYHMLERPRNCPEGVVATAGGFKDDDERDETMTRESSEDLCWIRPGRKFKGGSEKNLERRASANVKPDVV